MVDAGGPREDGDDSAEPSGRPLTPRARVKSAALWGAVGFFSFLVLTLGYPLLDRDLPFGYPTLFAIALVVAVSSGGIAYLTEHRLIAKERV